MSYIGKIPANAVLTTADLADGIVTAAKIEDGTVVAAEIASNAVTTAKINADAVTGAKIADDAINSEHYTDGSIDTAHIADVNVTQGKIADQAINEAKMQISNAPTNGYMLTAQSGNTGGLTWAEAGGGGVENITTYRLTTNFTMSANTNQITDNWSAAGASLGTAVSNSSGTFSFPQTGYWKIETSIYLVRIQGDSDYIGVRLGFTTDNSNYNDVFQSYTHINDTGGQHSFVYGTGIIDVTNISNDKVRMSYESESGTNIRATGNNNHDLTYIRFIRLGDT